MHALTKAALALLAASPAVLAGPIQIANPPIPGSPIDTNNVDAPKTTAPPTSAQEPCGAISSMQAELKAKTPTAVLTVPYALATNCFNSVKLNKKNAIDTAQGMQNYVQFQSTLSFLKNPPSNDRNQAKQSYDVMGDLKQLVKDLQADKYKNELDFQFRLKRIAANANDGHFVMYLGGILAMQFRAPFDIVSISEDGIKLPKIYRAQFNADTTITPVGPSIDKIDGKDVIEYISAIVEHTGLQSPDARFNSLSPTHGLAGTVAANGRFRSRPNPPEAPNFTVSYSDGTSQTYNYTAVVAGDFSKVKDSDSFYQEFVVNGQRFHNPPPNCPNGDRKDHHMSLRKGKKVPDAFHREADLNVPAAAKVASTRSGAITPAVKDNAGIFAGFFLDNDPTGTAILQLLSFEPDCSSDLPDTIAKIAEFLDLCRKNKTKNLIVDLQNNPGGYIVLGYDLFLQLFPDGTTYSGQRQRSPRAGKIMADAFKGVTYDDLANNQNSTMYGAIGGSNWDLPCLLNQNDKPFHNIKEFVGPYRTNYEDYTAIWRFNVTDPVSGLGLEDPSLNPPKPAAFKPENIVVFTDGQCSSTCSTFSEFMQTQKKVRSVVVGGLPQNKGMPLVGGVRGSEILDFGNLLSSGQAVGQISPNPSASEAADRKANLPAKLPLPYLAAVNFLDNVRKGESVPLQFKEEPATCRLYWTQDTYAHQDKLWKAVSDAAFHGAKCASQGGYGGGGYGYGN